MEPLAYESKATPPPAEPPTPLSFWTKVGLGMVGAVILLIVVFAVLFFILAAKDEWMP